MALNSRALVFGKSNRQCLKQWNGSQSVRWYIRVYSNSKSCNPVLQVFWCCCVLKWFVSLLWIARTMARDYEQEVSLSSGAPRGHPRGQREHGLFAAEDGWRHHPPAGRLWGQAMERSAELVHPTGQRGHHGHPSPRGQVWLPEDSRSSSGGRGHQPASCGQAPPGPAWSREGKQDGCALFLNGYFWPVHWWFPVCAWSDTIDTGLSEGSVWHCDNAQSERSRNSLAA